MCSVPFFGNLDLAFQNFVSLWNWKNIHLISLSSKVPEVQKKATFEERVLITEERISVAIPEEIPSPEGTL